MNKKYALCVGINDYPGTGSDLNGCVNDANEWAELLASQGGYEVNVMLNGMATLSNVWQALVEMVAQARFGDRVVFTYSGHGSWVPDRDGDEADGRDEVLVLHDFQSGGLLRDDMLQGLFSHLRRGAGALILSDSCHSGTVSRVADLGGPRTLARLDQPKLPRFLSPVAFTDLTEERVVELEAKMAGNPRATASLISGSSDDEYSWDAWFGGRANGAFSRVAIDHYYSGIRLGAWHQAIRAQLPTENFPQTPQLTVASPYRKYSRAI